MKMNPESLAKRRRKIKLKEKNFREMWKKEPQTVMELIEQIESGVSFVIVSQRLDSIDMRVLDALRRHGAKVILEHPVVSLDQIKR